MLGLQIVPGGERSDGTSGTAAGVENDAALVAAARACPAAFAPLYARYLQPVYRYCYLRLGDRAAAEDATSEVFIKALAICAWATARRPRTPPVRSSSKRWLGCGAIATALFAAGSSPSRTTS